MTPIISTDSFEAFRTEDGILINEKRKSAKKIGLVVTGVGVAFVTLSFVDLSDMTAKWIYALFFNIFRWGGIVLIVAGLITFILKGLLMSASSVSIDQNKREVELRGKTIPFSEINSVFLQTQPVLGKSMTVILFDHQGKNKAFVAGALLGSNLNELENFVEEVNAIIRS